MISQPPQNTFPGQCDETNVYTYDGNAGTLIVDPGEVPGGAFRFQNGCGTRSDDGLDDSTTVGAASNA